MQLKLDHQLMDDLARIADSWNVPPSTCAYWLLRGLMADARGEAFVITGDSLSERLGRYLLRRFPTDIGANPWPRTEDGPRPTNPTSES
jgi:hypothetical protein